MSFGQGSCYAKSAQAGSVVLQCWVKKRWVDFGSFFCCFCFVCVFCFLFGCFFCIRVVFVEFSCFVFFFLCFFFACFTRAARNLVFAERN